ncbi:MAG TPA: hypothetical protein VJ742_06635, partial [Nitrososphaera sp.]|nr:hypothetical protein [Nitrososphaera sp.]
NRGGISRVSGCSWSKVRRDQKCISAAIAAPAQIAQLDESNVRLVTKKSVSRGKIFLSYQLLLTQSLSPDADMVLLTPAEINRFISTLRTRYTAVPTSDKRRSHKTRLD